MKIADQVTLNQAALDSYQAIASAMPDAETAGDYGWYFSTVGIPDMTETADINGKTWHYKTFDPSGIYGIRVYSTADLEAE